MAEEEVTKSVGDLLVLRRPGKRSSSTWDPDDYDVFSGDRDIGRIFKAGRCAARSSVDVRSAGQSRRA